MLYPRLVTLLVVIGLSAIAAVLFLEVYIIPLPLLHLAVIVLSTFFASSALWTFVGMFGMYKTNDGLKFNLETLLGRVMKAMNPIDPFRAKELHCCDVYMNTSISTLAVYGSVVFPGVVILGLINAPWISLALFAVVGFSVAVIIGISFRIEYVAKKVNSSRFKRLIRPLVPTLRTVFKVIIYCVAIIAVVGSFYLVAMLPLLLMVDMGYSFFASLAILFFSLSILGFPAYCYGGKKLMQRSGKLGALVCPAVSR